MKIKNARAHHFFNLQRTGHKKFFYVAQRISSKTMILNITKTIVIETTKHTNQRFCWSLLTCLFTHLSMISTSKFHLTDIHVT